MAEPRYAVAFDGTVRSDCDPDQVKAQLTAALKLRSDHIEKLFSGARVVVKRGLLHAQALRLQAIFNEAGAVCEVIAEPPAHPSPTPGGPTSNPSANPDARPAGAEASRGPGGMRLGPGDMPGLFSTRLPSSPPSAAGRTGLIGAASAALVVPALYALLVIAVGFATIWHAFHGLLYLEQRSLIGAWFLYLLPIALGAVAFIYLLKPVLAKLPLPPERVELEPLREPVLFALAQQVAETLGAPRPERTWVDIEPTASLDVSRGGLELTIGMPLLAGLSTRQLVGVLGHEFGYFAPGPDARAAHLVRRAHRWLYRAVHERDAWDVAIAAWQEHPVSWIASLSRAVEWTFEAQRRALDGLARLSRPLSQSMRRRMALDADYYQAQLAGSAQFRATAERTLLLRQAFDDIRHEMSGDRPPGRLPEDLAEAMVRRADELASLAGSTIRSQEDEDDAAEANPFSPDPPDAERIAKAEALNAPASFTLDIPARALVKKYDRLAARITEGFYRGVLGIAPAQEAQASSTPSSGATPVKAPTQAEVLSDYCRELFVADRFVAPQDWRDYQALSPEARRERLDALVARLGEDMPEIARCVNRYRHPAEQPSVPAGEQSFEGAALLLEEPIADRVPASELEAQRLDLDAALSRHEAVLAERLAIALGGLIQEGGEHSEIAREVERLLAVQTQLAALGESYHTLNRGLNSSPNSGGPGADLDTSGLAEHLERIKTDLAKINYPFSHAGGETTVFAQLHEQLPALHPNEPASVTEYGRALSEALTSLHRRVFARLAELALGYERGMGVAPMVPAPAGASPTRANGEATAAEAAPDGA